MLGEGIRVGPHQQLGGAESGRKGLERDVGGLVGARGICREKGLDRGRSRKVGSLAFMGNVIFE